MKFITLNTWGGTLGQDFLDFFKKYSDVDIFFLQEVFHNATEITAWENTDRRELFDEITALLPEHIGYFASTDSNEWGLAAFIRKGINVEETGSIFVHKHIDAMVNNDPSTLGRNIQYFRIIHNRKPFTMINFHGLWNGKGKTDTDDRLNQSRKIVEFIRDISHDHILAGDFNLLPTTESLKMIGKELNLHNLVIKNGVTSTRTSHYTKPDKFADYIFVSNGIKPKEFKVLPDEVSDHAALYLEF